MHLFFGEGCFSSSHEKEKKTVLLRIRECLTDIELEFFFLPRLAETYNPCQTKEGDKVYHNDQCAI